jgi:hypothetical protein
LEELRAEWEVLFEGDPDPTVNYDLNLILREKVRC